MLSSKRFHKFVGFVMSTVEVSENNINILIPKSVLTSIEGLVDYITGESDNFYIIEIPPTNITIISEVSNAILNAIASEGMDAVVNMLMILKAQGEFGLVRKVIDLSNVFSDLFLEVSVMNKFKIIIRLGKFRSVLINEDRSEVDVGDFKELLKPIFKNPEDELFKIFVLENHMFKVKGFVSSEFIKYFPDKLYGLGLYAVPKDKKLLGQIRDKLLENIHILGSVYKEDINFEKVGVYASLVRKGCLESFSLDKYTIVYVPPLSNCSVHLNNNEKYLLNSISTIFDEKVKKLSELTSEGEEVIKKMIYKKFGLM